MLRSTKMRILISEKNDSKINLDFVFETLKRTYPVIFAAVYSLKENNYLYIQSSSAMTAVRVVNILRKFIDKIEFTTSEPFEQLDGDPIQVIGKLRHRGCRGKGAKPAKGKKPIEFTKLELKEKIIEQESTIEALFEQRSTTIDVKKRKGPGQLFYAVHVGYERDWKIVCWLPKTEHVRTCTKLFRGDLMKKQDNKCNYCDVEVKFGDYSNADVDHKIPLCLGGRSNVENLHILCTPCHRYKSRLESLSFGTPKSMEEMGF